MDLLKLAIGDLLILMFFIGVATLIKRREKKKSN
jgi:cbb3-type cytochrome oxidase subunit 3